MTTGRRIASDIFTFGILAGVAGGLAEIAWIWLYAAATGGNAAVLARGVTIAAGASALLPQAPVSTGIAVHMILAAMLGIRARRSVAGAGPHTGRRRPVCGRCCRARECLGDEFPCRATSDQSGFRALGALFG